jgi:hypothetical protein
MQRREQRISKRVASARILSRIFYSTVRRHKQLSIMAALTKRILKEANADHRRKRLP